MSKKELIEIIRILKAEIADEYSEPLLFQNLKLKNMLLLLEHSRDLYSSLYDYSHVGTVTFDKKGIIKNINLTLSSMLGMDRQNLSGTPFLVFVSKEYIQDYLKYIRKIVSSKDNHILEFKLKCGDIYRDVQMHTIQIIDYETSSPLYQNTIIDISAKKKIEEFLVESESRFVSLADSAPVLIWMSDIEKKCTYVNKQWLKFTGKPLDEEVGEGWVKNIHPNDQLTWSNGFNSAFDDRKEFKINCRLMNAKGEYRWFLITGTPRFAENEFFGYIGSCIDFTDQKNYEIEQERTIKEKIALVKEIHHRVKNNLQIISSLLGLQSSNSNHEEVNEALVTSSNRVKTMALIHENLYKSHNLSEIHFDVYLNDILINIFNTYRTDHKEIRLKTDIAPIILDADRAIHVGLLVNELITNAIKYAFKNRQSGELIVCFNRYNNNKYELIISDNGIGLPDGLLFNNTSTLGLTLVNSFVEQLKGEINLDQSNGTTFTITF